MITYSLISLSLIQPPKAQSSIAVTLLGISMEFRLVQPEKAYSLIDFTLLGILMEVKPVQPEKALLPIDVYSFVTYNVSLYQYLAVSYYI